MLTLLQDLLAISYHEFLAYTEGRKYISIWADVFH